MKNVATSKEVWYNSILMMIELLALAVDVVPIEALPYLMFAQGVGTLILRIWFTKTALTFKKVAPATTPESDPV